MFHKIFFALLFLAVSSITFSQTLDDSFLETLPKEIRDDFLKESQSPRDSNKNYQNPDTRIQNLESALSEAEDTLKKIRYDLDKQEKEHAGELKRFGHDFFSTFQSTFLPVNVPNFDGSYILDAGDELTLQFLGQRDDIRKIVIKRDGTLNIPDIGNVSIAGFSLSQAVEIINAQVNKALIGVEVFVSLSKIRDMNVVIVGNVNKPGMYTVSGASTPLSLLNAAGGIKENGSFRKILHKRNNMTIQVIDLYKLFINGEFDYSHSLRSGDVIVVPPKTKEISLSGSFVNPAIYEVVDDEALEDILNMATQKGISIDNKLFINRFSNGQVNSLTLDLNKIDSANFELYHGDSIEYYSIDPKFNYAKTVTLTGAVNLPGVYSIPDGYRLSDLIKLAGGYTDEAYPLGGVMIRSSAIERESKLRDQSYFELVRYLVASPNFYSILASPDSDGIVTFLSLLKGYDPIGRINTEFDLFTLEKNPQFDRAIEDGDKIHIPQFIPEVHVYGEISNPGSFQYNELGSVRDYINLAGDLTRVADDTRIVIISPNGDASVYSDRGLFGFNYGTDTILPGSTIYVPREIGKLDGINLASTISPIISSVALSLASLNSISN